MDSFCPMGSGSMAGMEISSYHLALLDHLAQIDQTDSGQVVSGLIQRASGIPVQSGIQAQQCGIGQTSGQDSQGPELRQVAIGKRDVFSTVKKSCNYFLR